MFARRRYRDNDNANTNNDVLCEENIKHRKSKRNHRGKKLLHPKSNEQQIISIKTILLIIIIIITLFFLEALRVYNNLNFESIIANNLNFRIKSTIKKKQQTHCKFISFDRKDNVSHYLPDWEDNIYLHWLHKFKIRTRGKAGGYKRVKMFKSSMLMKEEALSSHRRLEEETYFSDSREIRKNNNSTYNIRRNEKVYFIHIGKTGGSSLACNIRVARIHTPSCKHISLLQKSHGDDHKDQRKESAISRHITKRFHMQEPDTNGTKYVISIRNPVERIKSWFLYEHPRNFRKTVQRSSKNPANRFQSCGQIMLYMCYDQLDDLATIGLKTPRPPEHLFSDPKVHTMNITSDDCAVWAWGAVQGSIAATYHNYWNYQRLALPILSQINNTNDSHNHDDGEIQLYVIRTEFLWQDFITINTHFNEFYGNDEREGDKNNNHDYGKLSIPTNELHKAVNSMDYMRLNVTNKTISDEGMNNLCRALCDEIQIYKQLLNKAVNLNDDDRENSMSQLRETCPEESSIQIRECDYSP